LNWNTEPDITEDILEHAQQFAVRPENSGYLLDFTERSLLEDVNLIVKAYGNLDHEDSSIRERDSQLLSYVCATICVLFKASCVGDYNPINSGLAFYALRIKIGEDYINIADAVSRAEDVQFEFSHYYTNCFLGNLNYEKKT